MSNTNTRYPKPSKRLHVLVIPIVVLTLTGSAASVHGAASFVLLGDVPGGSVGARVTAISGDGSAVVGEFGITEAFRWTATTGMQPLGMLPGPYHHSQAWGVSNGGKVVVGRSNHQAFRWTEAEGMMSLGHLNDTYPYSEATDVSNNGTVIIGSSRIGANLDRQAFRWTTTGGMQALGMANSVPSAAKYASADGSVVVGRYRGGFYRWTEENGMQDLDSLVSPSTGIGQVTGLSADGNVLVGYGAKPFRWSEADGGQLLDTEAFTPIDHKTWNGRGGISGDGSVITITRRNTFIWTKTGGTRLLQDMFKHDYGLDLTGWDLHNAVLSDDGLTIAGTGRFRPGTEFDTGNRPWIVYLDRHPDDPVPIPAPGALLLTSLGVATVVGFRKRKE